MPVILKESDVDTILQRARESERYELTVDLESRLVTDTGNFSVFFAIEDFQRHCLMEGLDDVGITLQHEAEIVAFERQRPAWAR